MEKPIFFTCLKNILEIFYYDIKVNEILRKNNKSSTNLHSENCQNTERNEGSNVGKAPSDSEIVGLKIVKMAILPKLCIEPNITCQNPADSFVEITKMILKLKWNGKGPRILNN